ncbi:S53 family peptidase [Polyangium sp. 6x1]|uniref:S53 family peptidase n=1 Tax=Polyangium sp. 6x1 TaxID=3042689 RepID=UPI002482F85F|nr:S53 family peptidase [Polyangium sp. 6x1]MDI1449276.1 S53 family peptidase [Polyangium sp. 6x1]
MDLATREPPRDDVSRCTLVLRTRSELPSVQQICKYPPSRPTNRAPDAFPSPGHLDYAQFEERYGATESALEAVESFVVQRGLRVVDPGSFMAGEKLSGAVKLMAALTLEGPTRSFEGVERLDGVIHVLRSARVPPALHTPAYQRQKEARGGAPAASNYSARQIAELYEYPAPAHGLPGEGQCLGLIEMAGTYDARDIARYFETFAPMPVIAHVPAGGEGAEPSYTFDVEVTMGVELAGTVCPGAKIVLYNHHSQDFSVHDLYRVMATAIFDTQNQPSVLSVAWCAPEGADASISQAEEAALNELLVKATLLGITICAPSGDFGSMNPVHVSERQGVPLLVMGSVTCYPAASPLVLACGGTKLIAEGNRIREEVVWNQLAQRWSIEDERGHIIYSGPGGASGGGVSVLNSLPVYQEGLDVPEAVTMTARGTVVQPLERYRGRGIPDIAASADLLHGYDIYFDGQWGSGGATSAASPVLAGLIIRLNQMLGRRLGFIHPFLYELQREKKNLFRTTEKGSNGGYDARPGQVWNPCTGLGSPMGRNLLKALKKLYG